MASVLADHETRGADFDCSGILGSGLALGRKKGSGLPARDKWIFNALQVVNGRSDNESTVFVLLCAAMVGSCKGNAKEVLVSPWQAEMLPTNAKPAIKANQEAALVK